ncbi:hypothetical protein [Peptoniphilus raoultii]|uniref:hypothetical protein n=1 Tax=Peptoniphilus raoultii TaxID=1776387 RepID=UPI0008D8ED08|nr:hypothetical protein [Peptoniphilus raoultii]
MYYLTFENEIFFDGNLDISFLKDLVRLYLGKADFFEIRSLEEDKIAREFIKNYGAYDENESFEEIGSGIIDEDLRDGLLNILLKDKQTLNFYKLSLFRENILIMEILNYGEEVSIYNLNEKEVVNLANELESLYGLKEINISKTDD